MEIIVPIFTASVNVITEILLFSMEERYLPDRTLTAATLFFQIFSFSA